MTAVVLFLLAWGTPPVITADYVALTDPEVSTIPVVMEFDERCLSLWKAALNRPEAGNQRMAALTIVRARPLGMPGLASLIPDLRQRLVASETEIAARFAVAQALLALEDRESAGALLEQARAGTATFRSLVEPQLAEWQFEPARQIWTTRLEAQSGLRTDLLHAIRGLGALGDVTAVELLRRRAFDPQQSNDIRLAAAEALGKIAPAGIEDDARRLSESAETLSRLQATLLLSRQDSMVAQQLLTTLCRDSESAVAANALPRLRTIDATLVLPLGQELLPHPDAAVRREVVEAYLALPNAERIAAVGRLLDDPHPKLRGRIRDAFVELSQRQDWNLPVITICRTVVGEPGWRGQEQALLVLGSLNDKTSAGRFVELLQAPRDEVMVAAAWGLRRLALPETLPAVIEQIERQTRYRQQAEKVPAGLDAQVAHLCETIGILKHQPADQLLQQYIPCRPIMGDLSRRSAIWALGKMHDGRMNDALAEKLIARVTDTNWNPAETSEVRQMSAVALARMGAVSMVGRLKAWVGPMPGPSRETLINYWALQQLTGEEFAPPPPQRVTRGTWFLEPITGINHQ